MDQKVKRLLENKGNNYIFPFSGSMESPKRSCVSI